MWHVLKIPDHLHETRALAARRDSIKENQETRVGTKQGWVSLTTWVVKTHTLAALCGPWCIWLHGVHGCVKGDKGMGWMSRYSMWEARS